MSGRPVQIQPGRAIMQFENQWTSDLCNCCDDCSNCKFIVFFYIIDALNSININEKN